MNLGLAIVAIALQATPAGAQPPETPVPQVVEIAPGVHHIVSPWQPGRGPDGATIILDAPDGLIVVDTGRHVWQSDAIVNFARIHARPIAAIINTHWHLDHASGNVRIKAAFPDARTFATNTVDRALADGGFLHRNYESAQRSEQEGEPVEREERQLFLDTMAQSAFLRPDIVLSTTQRMIIGGRPLDVHVAERAVTDADLWLYDAETRTAILGDLVTLPAPFFETACPQEWSAALDSVWATPFEFAIPGHGAPMDRTQFNIYRTAFNAFIECARGKAEAERCVTLWTEGIAALEPDNAPLHQQARGFAAYYVEFLRENDGKSPDCLAEG